MNTRATRKKKTMKATPEQFTTGVRAVVSDLDKYGGLTQNTLAIVRQLSDCVDSDATATMLALCLGYRIGALPHGSSLITSVYDSLQAGYEYGVICSAEEGSDT